MAFSWYISLFCIGLLFLIKLGSSTISQRLSALPFTRGVIQFDATTSMGMALNVTINLTTFAPAPTAMEQIPEDKSTLDSQHYVPYILRDAYEVIRKIAINNTVMTSFTDYGYLRHFYTFYEMSHLERYPNFYVTTIDEQSYEDVKRRGIPAILYRVTNVDTSSLQKDAVITSKTFHKKVVNKLGYLSNLMRTGLVVLYMDCDILLFRDPWPVLRSYSASNADIVAQKDDSLNSGFMLLFPTAVTQKLISEGEKYMLREKELDQESLVIVSKHFKNLRLVLLPTDWFSNGRIFFARHQFFWDAIQPSEIMMHNNYIVGSNNKFYRWREMRFYEEDEGGYYSSPPRSYLMIDAPNARRNNTLYLHQVAVLSRLLNRTFLLPTFPCPPSIPLEKCNLCRNDVECFKRFRQLIREDFRDYVSDVT